MYVRNLAYWRTTIFVNCLFMDETRDCLWSAKAPNRSRTQHCAARQGPGANLEPFELKSDQCFRCKTGNEKAHLHRHNAGPVLFTSTHQPRLGLMLCLSPHASQMRWIKPPGNIPTWPSNSDQVHHCRTAGRHDADLSASRKNSQMSFEDTCATSSAQQADDDDHACD